MAESSQSFRLKLREAVLLVAELSGCKIAQARHRLLKGGLDGVIKARGKVPRNLHRDDYVARRLSGRHGRPKDIEPADWARSVDWSRDKVGRAFDVLVERPSILELLASRETREIAAPVEPKRRAGAKPTKRQAIAVFIAKHYPEGIPAHVKLDAIRSDFESETASKISDRTLRRAIGRK